MKKILLLYGGNSFEHDVSCASAQSIIDNIDKTKYELDSVKITKENKWLKDDIEINNIIEFINNYDVVFPMIHGSNGEDGRLQGFLEMFGIKYVGSKCGPSYICMDKERTKIILNNYNIPQVPYQLYDKNEKLIIPFPVIIKPSNGGSSIGINVAYNKKEYKKAINEAYKYDKKIIIEKLVKVQELECAVLENKKLIVSEVGEILPCNEFYDYDAKYKNNSKTIIPANISKEISNKIKEYAIKAFEVLELSGYARIDFFYDYENNKIYLNEINTIPGFTNISMYPKLIIDKGITYTDLITKLIESAK